jgi:putative intracellular protease/amidase
MLDFVRMLTHPLLFQPKVVVAGNLITGQNPASGHPIGEAILQALQK